MKELSIEQKAERYDEISKEVKDFFDGKQKMYSDVEQTLNHLFPELKESEDEIIRKDIIDFVKSRLAGFPKCDRFISWLEKQSERKSTWTEEDEKRLNSCLIILQPKTLVGNTETMNTKWLKSLKERIGG